MKKSSNKAIIYFEMRVVMYFIIAIELILSQVVFAQEIGGCEFLKGIKISNPIKCGRITVPEDHANHEGSKIQIAYAIIPSKAETNEYPVILFSGGPGGASLTENGINFWKKSPFNRNRDIILFDQRGIGYSNGLPNMGSDLMKVLAKDASQEEEFLLVKAVVDKYKTLCEGQGVNLANYTTTQNALDVGVLMQELGYEKYNLRGGSYGALLARVVQDKYPEMLNTVILDSPGLYTSDFLETRLESLSKALTRLFDFCENDKICSEQYPNLKNTYLEVIQELVHTPIELINNGNSFTINAQDAVFQARRLLYRSDAKVGVPAFIIALKERDKLKLLEAINYQFDYNSIFNYTMLLAIERHYGFNPANTKVKSRELYNKYPLIPAQLGLFDSFYIAGMGFHGNNISETERKMKESHIPTLIMSNYLDPVTPVKNGQALQQQLPNSQLLILDAAGHVGSNECKLNYVNTYMSNPNSNISSDCLNLKSD